MVFQVEIDTIRMAKTLFIMKLNELKKNMKELDVTDITQLKLETNNNLHQVIEKLTSCNLIDISVKLSPILTSLKIANPNSSPRQVHAVNVLTYRYNEFADIQVMLTQGAKSLIWQTERIENIKSKFEVILADIGEQVSVEQGYLINPLVGIVTDRSQFINISKQISQLTTNPLVRSLNRDRRSSSQCPDISPSLTTKAREILTISNRGNDETIRLYITIKDSLKVIASKILSGKEIISVSLKNSDKIEDIMDFWTSNYTAENISQQISQLEKTVVNWESIWDGSIKAKIKLIELATDLYYKKNGTFGQMLNPSAGELPDFDNIIITEQLQKLKQRANKGVGRTGINMKQWGTIGTIQLSEQQSVMKKSLDEFQTKTIRVVSYEHHVLI